MDGWREGGREDLLTTHALFSFLLFRALDFDVEVLEGGMDSHSQSVSQSVREGGRKGKLRMKMHNSSLPPLLPSLLPPPIS